MTVFIIAIKRIILVALSVIVGICETIMPSVYIQDDIRTTYTVDGVIYEVEDFYGIEDAFILELEDLGYNNIKVYESENLSTSEIENRNPYETIVERVIGIVTCQKTGDGRIINNGDDYYNYISYNGIGVEIPPANSVVLTYLVYNPHTQYTDDIIERYDFPLRTLSISNAE